MLKDRILFTLKFFDLQQTPLTLFELRDFLFNEPEILGKSVDSNYELSQDIPIPARAEAEEIALVLKRDLSDLVELDQGYVCLTGSKALIGERIKNSIYRDSRERIIKLFVPGLRFVPFVRGVAIGGSHTLGQNKKDSDIDLLTILDPGFLWLGRLMVTGYLQLTGHRRHGGKVQNRFCLNHYLAGPIEVREERDPYNAMEYLRLRPEVYGDDIGLFVRNNLSWIRKFFPNARVPDHKKQRHSRPQFWLERLFMNGFGKRLNQKLGEWQIRRIRRGQPAVANESELSFHSKQRKFEFLARFFESYK